MRVERQRLQLEASPAMIQRLDTLAEETGCATRSEMVRRALEVYGYLVAARTERGARIVLDVDGKQSEIVIPKALR